MFNSLKSINSLKFPNKIKLKILKIQYYKFVNYFEIYILNKNKYK